jgi:ribosomal protein S18 acetylase RimI-like enzyme
MEDPRAHWRITCFVTRKDHRRRGVATIALAAALNAIAARGGGWIEAAPIVAAYHDPRYHEIANAYGRESEELRRYLASWPTHLVRGIGLVPAKRGSLGSVGWPGTVAMFLRQGFQPLKIAGDVYVTMRREQPAQRPRSDGP